MITTPDIVFNPDVIKEVIMPELNVIYEMFYVDEYYTEDKGITYIIKVVDSGKTIADKEYEITDKKTSDNCFRYGARYINALWADYQRLGESLGYFKAEELILDWYEKDKKRKCLYTLIDICRRKEIIAENLRLPGSDFIFDACENNYGLDLQTKKMFEKTLSAKLRKSIAEKTHD